MDPEKLDEQGAEQYSVGYISFENGLYATQVGLGVWLMLPFAPFGVPLLSILFALFAFVMLGFVLRKHLCTGCYYYGKNCHCGWGKLAKLLYKKEQGDYRLGGKLAVLTWPLLMVLPIVAAVVSLIFYQVHMLSTLAVLGAFVVVVAVGMVLHIKDCKNCKMRFVCPGSAAKG